MTAAHSRPRFRRIAAAGIFFQGGAAAIDMWTLYAFVGSIVAVAYNDIVARSIPSPQRSRLLVWRFFGGGLLALAVAAGASGLSGPSSFLRTTRWSSCWGWRCCWSVRFASFPPARRMRRPLGKRPTTRPMRPACVIPAAASVLAAFGTEPADEIKSPEDARRTGSSR